MFPFIAHRSVQARIENISEMMEWIAQEIKRVGFSYKKEKTFLLAFEEAIVNVIKHSGTEVVDIISCSDPKGSFKVTLIDEGKPFNPQKKQISIEAHVSLEKRKVGGLGLFLMSEGVDEVIYERDEPFNILQLITSSFQLKK